MKIKIPTSNAVSYLFYFSIAIAAIFLLIIKIRFLQIPLERDEGEYAYIAQLILNGHSPWEAFSYKIPGVAFIYSIFMFCFGQNIFAIKLSLLIFNLGTCIFLFLIIRKVLGNFHAAVTILFFSVFIASASMLCFAAHATHYVLFFITGALWFYIIAAEKFKNKYFILSGLFFGLAILMKQHAIFFIPVIFFIPSLLTQIFHPTYIFNYFPQHLLLASGVLFPLIMTGVFAWLKNDLFNFCKWTFVYSLDYASSIGFYWGWINLKSIFFRLFKEFTILWILALSGLSYLFFNRIFSLYQKLFLLAFLLLSFISILPGFYFRNHYFILLLPAVSVFIALSIDFTDRLPKERISSNLLNPYKYIFFILVFGVILFQHRNYFFIESTNQICRNIYLGNPFVESIPIADYIKNNTTKTDKIAVLGSEPQILFYADRKSATSFIYAYHLVSGKKYDIQFQQQAIKEIEREKPKYFVLINSPTSWAVQSNAPLAIFNWINYYLSQNYTLTGLVDYFKDNSVIKFDQEIGNYTPMSSIHVLIFKKNN
jgi:hypothetical protein